jgi:hypothetical protein
MQNPKEIQLFTYTVMDGTYQKGKLMNIQGLEDAVPGNVGTLGSPKPSKVGLNPGVSNPGAFSFIYEGAGNRELRLLIGEPADIYTDTGSSFQVCPYTLLKMDPDLQDWTVLARNIQFINQRNSLYWATDPRGLCQIGNMLFILDYETGTIYLLEGDELNGKIQGATYTPQHPPCNVGAVAGLPSNAKGQALIALPHEEPDGSTHYYLFALFVVGPDDAGEFQPSILVRLEVGDPQGPSPYSLTCNGQTKLGRNAQRIIPISPTNANWPFLLIPASGGIQNITPNSGASRISRVPAFGSWQDEGTSILETDYPDRHVPVYSTYNIQAIAASTETSPDALVYILAHIYEEDYQYKQYVLYKTTAGKLAQMQPSTSVADALAQGDLTLVETGGAPGYCWDIFYANKGQGETGRLWFLRGSTIIVSSGPAYGARSTIFGPGESLGQTGGQIITSADMTGETARQVADEGLSKQGLQGLNSPVLVSSSSEEEEED